MATEDNAPTENLAPPVRKVNREQETDGAPAGTEGVNESGVPVDSPPPAPISIFQVISEATDLDSPKQRIAERIQQIIDDSSIKDAYDFIFLYDEHMSISRFASSRLYSAATGPSRNRERSLFLLMHTNGGQIEPAYLISKCCKRSARKFVVSVPRLAKSAGTLIALGADEIHMGMMSELGPIDPQMGNYPALGLGSAVDYIANLCKKHPEAAEMFSKYLASSLNLHDLGYFERVSESAAQYAERLLADKSLPAGQTAASIAHRFVYEYKDHGFVIDRDEALEILGPTLVRFETPEYKVANQIHEYLEIVNFAYSWFHRRYCRILGTIREGIFISEMPA